MSRGPPGGSNGPRLKTSVLEAAQRNKKISNKQVILPTIDYFFDSPSQQYHIDLPLIDLEIL